MADSKLSVGLNGLIRIPVLVTGLKTGELALEGIYRVIVAAFRVIGFSGQPSFAGEVQKRLPLVRFDVFRSLSYLSHKELAATAVAGFVITALGWEIANWLCGKVPPAYNNIGKLIVPFQLDSEWHNPLVNGFNKVFNRGNAGNPPPGAN